MKYKPFLFGMVVIGLALTGLSCKSTPSVEDFIEDVEIPVAPDAQDAAPVTAQPTTPGTVVEPGTREPSQRDPTLDAQPADDATLASLDAAAAQTADARLRALVFDAPIHDMAGWEAAEARYNAQDELVKRSTRGEVEDGLAFYQQLTRDYEGIFETIIPLYMNARQEEIARARAEAIEAGIQDLSPERLALADSKAEEFNALFLQKDYFAAADTASQAVDMYFVLKISSLAHGLQQEIEQNEFEKYDEDNYSLAGEVLAASLAAYDANAIGESIVNAEESYLRYSLVLAAGWQAYATERAAAAEEELRNALERKANVAVREDFNAASDIYNRAQASFRSEQYADAADLYFQSEYLFAVVSVIAEEKRLIAEEAIRIAEERAAASDERAREAESILQGGVE